MTSGFTDDTRPKAERAQHAPEDENLKIRRPYLSFLSLASLSCLPLPFISFLSLAAAAPRALRLQLSLPFLFPPAPRPMPPPFFLYRDHPQSNPLSPHLQCLAPVVPPLSPPCSGSPVFTPFLLPGIPPDLCLDKSNIDLVSFLSGEDPT